MCYGSVQHIYSITRASFMKKLQELLEDDYVDFESLDKVEKSSYVLRRYSELWESKFDGLLNLVNEYHISSEKNVTATIYVFQSFLNEASI